MASFPEQILAAIEKLQLVIVTQQADLQSLKSCMVVLVGEVFGGGREISDETMAAIARAFGESQAAWFESLLLDLEVKSPAEAARLSELADTIRQKASDG